MAAQQPARPNRLGNQITIRMADDFDLGEFTGLFEGLILRRFLAIIPSLF